MKQDILLRQDKNLQINDLPLESDVDIQVDSTLAYELWSSQDNYIIDLTGFDTIEIINNEYEAEINNIIPDEPTNTTATATGTEHTTGPPPQKRERREVWQPVDFSKESNTPTFEEGTVEEGVYIERLMFHSNEDKEKFKKFLQDNKENEETEAQTINRLINRPVHKNQPATLTILFEDMEEHGKYKLLIKRLQENNILIPYLIMGGGAVPDED